MPWGARLCSLGKERQERDYKDRWRPQACQTETEVEVHVTHTTFIHHGMVYVAPCGDCYHLSSSCYGLRNASEIRPRELCRWCKDKNNAKGAATGDYSKR